MKRFEIVLFLSIFLLFSFGIAEAQEAQVIHANGGFAELYICTDSGGCGQLQVQHLQDGRIYLYFWYNSWLPDGSAYVQHNGNGYLSDEPFVEDKKSARLRASGVSDSVCTYSADWYTSLCEEKTASFDMVFTLDRLNYFSSVSNTRSVQPGMVTHTTGKAVYGNALVNGMFMDLPLHNVQGRIGYSRDNQITMTPTKGATFAPTLEDMKMDSQEVLSHFQRKAPSLKKADYTFTQIDYPGASLMRLFGINDAGVIAGSFALPGQPQQAFLLSKGVFTFINVPDAYMAQARGINNAGQVVGIYRDVNDLVLYGFLYSNGVFTKISHPTIVGDNYVQGIAADGTIVGHVVTDVDATSYVYKNGVYTSYSCGPGTYTQFQGIAANGMIVGNCDPDPATYLALYGTMGNFKQYQSPGIFAIGMSGVNANGTMVGSLQETDLSSPSRGFVFDGKNLALVEYPGATQTSTRGINAAGQIVGTFDNGTHGFIANPGNMQKPF